MKLDYAFICDYAEVTGKVNAMGVGFEVIFAPKVPAKHRFFYMVAQFRASSVEAGEKKLTVNLIDEDGHEVIPPIHGPLPVPRPKEGVETVARIALEFNGVEFPRYGSYSVHLLLDGTEMARVPFRVSPPPSPPQTPPQPQG